jgi:hypothetical protein
MLKKIVLIFLNIPGFNIIIIIKKAGIIKNAIGWLVSKKPRHAKQK